MSDDPLRFGRRKLLIASAGVATLLIGCDDPAPPGNLVPVPPVPGNLVPPEPPPEPTGPEVPEEPPPPEEEPPPPPGNLVPPPPPPEGQ